MKNFFVHAISKSFSCVLISALLMFTVACSAQENSLVKQDSLPLMDCLKRSAVYLICNSNGDTANGVILNITDHQLIIATNAHVAELFDESKNTAYAQSAECFPAFLVDILAVDKTKDLAFLTARTDALDASLLDYICAASYKDASYDDLEKGDILTCLYLDRIDPTGFFYPEASLGQAVLLDKNVPVQGFEENMMYLDYPSLSGMSGSGVFDQSGYLVGLISAGDKKQGTMIAVPLPALLSGLNSASQP